MDNNENKHTPTLSSPCKMQKMYRNQDQSTENFSPQNASKAAGYSTANSSIDNKMNNVAKLRQQFVEEIKNIELSLKKSIKNLKVKISETKSKTDIIIFKLTEANQLLCNQSEIIYTKEQENKVLRDNVEELYEYQKILYQNIEDIFNTLNIHENLSEKLMNTYDHVISMQQNENTLLEEKLNKIKPDEKLCVELHSINVQIEEFEKINIQNENEISNLELEIKTFKIYKEQQLQKIEEYDKKIHELEIRNRISKENADKEKNNLICEIEKIENETNIQKADILDANTNFSELENKLKKISNNTNEIELKIEEISNQINLLSNEYQKLDEIRVQEDQENGVTLEKLHEALKTTKDELMSVKQTESQATDILQRKICELNDKLKDFEDLETKHSAIESEIKKEQELVAHITKECEEKKKEYDNKIKVNNDKIMEDKVKINQVEHNISESEEKIKLMEEEINLLNKKIEDKIKENEKKAENPTFSTSISHCELPNLLVLEDLGNVEKQSSRKNLYTPTLAEDDLELDALTLEEQFTRLTQSNAAYAESPEKNKKFFKHSNLTQSKIKKEATPRPKGRSKKH